jgi:hypothetical protein
LTERWRRRALEHFYRHRILTLAAVGLRAAPGPDPATESYYEVCDRPPLRPSDFEIPFGAPREIAGTLDAHWAGTPLAGLGRSLVRISRLFRGVRQKEQVSSFIYEMF